MHDIDCVVIGAGVIGLACARALALTGLDVLVVDRAEGIGTGTSSRNSEVIHAGIYYPTSSLKARLCVQGRELLYAYCQARGIPHQRLGKLIVATNEEERRQLHNIDEQARQNGVELEYLDEAQARQLEPALQCVAALYSPTTGIIDSHAYMLSLQGDGENAGVHYAFRTPLLAGQVLRDGFVLEFGGNEPLTLSCRVLINCGGLNAVAIAHTLEGLARHSIPSAYYCKGTYFTLSGRAPFSRLIYPVPQHAGLGVHLTLDLAGQAKFGPDTEWVEGEDYAVDPSRAARFYDAVRRYWPGLPDNSLVPGYAGIRPKISGPSDPAADFAVLGPREHGVPGLVNLFGIESPGLTASLALAQYVISTLELTG